MYKALLIFVRFCSSYSDWNSPLVGTFGQLHAHSIDVWLCGPRRNPVTRHVFLPTIFWRSCQHCTSMCPRTYLAWFPQHLTSWDKAASVVESYISVDNRNKHIFACLIHGWMSMNVCTDDQNTVCTGDILLEFNKTLCRTIKRHTAHTIVSWPNPKQWVILHTSDLMMIIRQIIYIISIITKEMAKLRTHIPHTV